MKGSHARPARTGPLDALWLACITALLAVVAAVMSVGVGLIVLGGDNVPPGVLLVTAGGYIAFTLYRSERRRK